MNTSKTNPSKASHVGAKPFSLEAASLCSLAIALWGWQTGLFFIAIPIILILEARRVIHQRWEISPSDLKEAAKLSGALLLIVFVVVVTVKKAFFIYTLLQWLPVAGLPLLIAQTYGLGVREILIEQFSTPYLPSRSHQQPKFRQNERYRKLARRSPINLHYLYIGLCMVAASATDSDHFVFYGLATALTALVLWPLRPKRTSPLLWLLIFCLSIGLGFAGHRQIARFQQQLESQVIAMIGDLASGAINPNGNATRMGSVGRLKLSNRIVFRVDAEQVDAEQVDAEQTDVTFPLLLQEATYNLYSLSTWTADNSVFNDVPPGADSGDWVLGPASEQDTSITISTDLGRGNGVLTLPRGTSSIRQLPVEEMQRNQFGAVQVDAEGDVAYQIQFHPGVASPEARPTAADLQIPNADRAAIDSVLSQLSFQGQSERDIVRQIADYFQSFQYSLDLIEPDAATTAVSDFLLNTQAGHCEYFASATALLLRGAGIPARYAVGYSAHEFSPLEGQYIVRSRDAHAWTVFYLDGRWQVLDTTPADWAAQEDNMASPFQAVGDFFAFLAFQAGYRIRQLGELGLKEVLMIVIPLFCYLLWRSIQVFQGQQKSAAALNPTVDSRLTPAGLDSELYQIEATLSEQGLARLPAESFWQWCDRLQTSLPESQRPTFQKILDLHYRYRFDPKGLSATERQQLKSLSEAWIVQHLSETTPCY